MLHATRRADRRHVCLLQLAWLAVTQPAAAAAAAGSDSSSGLAGLLMAAAAARSTGGSGFGGSGFAGGIAGQLSSDPLRPLALMPDLQVPVSVIVKRYIYLSHIIRQSGSSISGQLSSDPLRPLALMPDLQVVEMALVDASIWSLFLCLYVCILLVRLYSIGGDCCDHMWYIRRAPTEI